MIKSVFLTSLLVLSGMVHAQREGFIPTDWVFKNDNVDVVLYEQANCTADLTELVHNLGNMGDLNWNRAVVKTADGRTLEACWAVADPKVIQVPGPGAIIVDEDHDGGFLPADKLVHRDGSA